MPRNDVGAFSRNRGWVALRKSFETGTVFRRAFLLPVLLILITAAVIPQYVVHAASPEEVADGQTIFEQKCAACHTVGGGDGIGPDLVDVTMRRDADWLTRWISAPDQMLAEGDPTATELLEQFNNIPMPNLLLTDVDVVSLIAYLGSSASGAPAEGDQEPEAASIEGDPIVGKNLFTGSDRLENGGPACRTCHSATGIGADAGVLGRGALGPDLTGVFGKLGQGMIAMPQTGTMAPIFSEKPLTLEEKNHLLAFFRAAGATERSTKTIWELVGLALAGVAVVAVVTQLIWRRRLRSVREPVVSGQASRRS